MRMLVVGAGATGGYFGGRLAASGREIAFLVRPARAEQLRRTGLRIKSKQGDAAITPTLVTAGSIGAPYDAVLLTVKAYGLEAALEDMAPAVGPDTAILPTLNGMRHMDALTARFGPANVAGCVCRIAAQLDAEGTVLQLAGFHELRYGEMDGTASARMQRLDSFMQGAGFDASLSPEVGREMWEKWILLCALGCVGGLMRGTVGEVVAAPYGLETVHALLDEVVAVVRAVGVPPSNAFLESARRTLTAAGSGFTSSMFRDMKEGKPIEADQIVGDLVARARSAAVPTPILAAAYASLSVYQARL